METYSAILHESEMIRPSGNSTVGATPSAISSRQPSLIIPGGRYRWRSRTDGSLDAPIAGLRADLGRGEFADDEGHALVEQGETGLPGVGGGERCAGVGDDVVKDDRLHAGAELV